MSLLHRDRVHLDAALGWLMLGNRVEAAAEFQSISRPYRADPDYLHIRCRLWIAEKQWPAALEISELQVRLAPDRPHGWISRAYCLHELERTRDAFLMLLPAATRFPRHEIISFNLACYSCHLENFRSALRWINWTIQLMEAKRVSW